jgi:hypothetical protein
VPSAIIHLERARRKGETTGAYYVKLEHRKEKKRKKRINW